MIQVSCLSTGYLETNTYSVRSSSNEAGADFLFVIYPDGNSDEIMKAINDMANTGNNIITHTGHFDREGDDTTEIDTQTE